MFDTLYFLGQTECSVWAITTSQGIILLDAIFDDSVEEEVVGGLKKLGLDPKVFHAIASNASGQSWSMTTYCPVPGVGPETPAERDYAGGFAAALMLKDLRLAMEAAAGVAADTPMGARANTAANASVTIGVMMRIPAMRSSVITAC